MAYIFQRQDVNDSIKAFTDIYVRHYNHCCPIKLCKIKKHDKAWITGSLIGSCKKMNILSIIQCFQSINQGLFSIQTNNNNIHTFFKNEY